MFQYQEYVISIRKEEIMGSVFQSVIIGIIGIALLIVLDLITKLASVFNAERNGFKFDWKKFLLFLKTGVAPYFLIWIGYSAVNIFVVWISSVYLVVTIPGFAEGIMASIIYAAAGAIALKVGNSIWENLKQLGVSPPKIE